MDMLSSNHLHSSNNSNISNNFATSKTKDCPVARILESSVQQDRTNRVIVSLKTGQIVGSPQNLNDVLDQSDKHSMQILFVFQYDEQCITWNTVLYRRDLYLNLVSGNNVMPAEYSKESFILLVETAEVQFRCNNVIVCLSKNARIRPFIFLGFELLPPNHPLVPYGLSEDMIFLSYRIELNDDM